VPPTRRRAQSKRFNGDIDAYSEAQDAAREKVLAALSPAALRDVYQTLWPHPARFRYTAVTLLPQRSLLDRAVAAHAALAAAWDDSHPAARGGAVLAAGALGALAAAAAYARWRAWRRAE
jgi:hypothetical protein